MAVQEEPEQSALTAAYTEVCRSYERIDDFRAKLLGFLPLVSGTGLLLVLERTRTDVGGCGGTGLLVAAGIFGFAVTTGLLFYELRGIQRCIRLSRIGKRLESQLNVEGRFTHWPKSLGRVINEPIAAAFIYSSVLVAWVFLALVAISLAGAILASGVVLLTSFGGVWTFYRLITHREDIRDSHRG